MHLMFKRNVNWAIIYVSIGILALIITVLVSSLFLPFDRYRLLCNDLKSKNLAKTSNYVFYNDFNLDGKTEKVLLNRITSYVSDPFVQITDANERVLLKTHFLEQWIYNGYVVGDFDHDSNKELYVFTRKRASNVHDSLFLYGINPFKKAHKFLNRIFITSFDRFFEASSYRKTWSITLNVIGFFDADDDGFDDLVFSINSKKYSTPRNIFIFSIKKKRIIKKSRNFKNFYSFSMLKNKSGKVFIYPKMEYLQNEFEHQDAAQNIVRFFVLNKHLEYAFKPFELHVPFSSRIYAYPLSERFDKFVIQRIYSGKTYFYLVSNKGKVLKKTRIARYFFTIDPVVDIERKTDVFNPMILSSNYGSLFKIDSTLRPQMVYKWENRQGNLYFRFNIDNDPQFEVLDIAFPFNSKYKKLAIFQDDFKSRITLNIPYLTDSKRVVFSLKSKTHKATILSLSSQNFDGLFLYGPNPYYHLNFLVTFVVFILITFLLYGFFKLINSLFFYYHFLARHLNTINKGVLLISFKGQVQHYNQNFVRMLNIQEIHTGMSVTRLLRPYPQILDSITKLLNGEHDEVNDDLTLQQADKIFKGHLFGYFLSGIPGIPSGYCVEIYDLSESILSEREEIIARLIRKMAHDIKTPLSTIKFAIEAMNYVLPADEFDKVKEDISTVSEEVNHIHAIANNYSKFARLSKLNLEIISIKDIIYKVVGSYGFMDTVKVSIKVAPDAEMLTADGTQIELLIKEIFENALDAVGREGEIIFETYPVTLGKNGQADAIYLRISDNGQGIAKDIKDRIFEPSFSTKGQGTGFGLVLAQRIVQNHGGKITIDSQEGKGTHVLIVLPKDAIEVTSEKEFGSES